MPKNVVDVIYGWSLGALDVRVVGVAPLLHVVDEVAGEMERVFENYLDLNNYKHLYRNPWKTLFTTSILNKVNLICSQTRRAWQSSPSSSTAGS